VQVVSRRGVFARVDLLGSRGRSLVKLRANAFVSGRRTDQTSAIDKAKSPVPVGLAPVRSLPRHSSITPTNAIRRKRIAVVPLASTTPTSSKIAEDRRQARRLSSQLAPYATASLLGGRAGIGVEFARKRNPTIHLTTFPWAAGKLPTAA